MIQKGVIYLLRRFADLCTPQSEDEWNIIDVTGGKDISAESLREKVEWLKGIGGRDGGFPIIKGGYWLGIFQRVNWNMLWV